MAAAIMDQVLEGPIAWTRESLSAWDGAVAVVSHDPDFLRSIGVQRTIELRPSG